MADFDIGVGRESVKENSNNKKSDDSKKESGSFKL